MEVRKCSNCNRVNPIEARYCEICGTPCLEESKIEPAESPAEPRICSSCQARNSTDARYCEICGASFQEESKKELPEIPAESRVCPSCQASNPARANYCTRCGNPLSQPGSILNSLGVIKDRSFGSLQTITNPEPIAANTTCYKCDQNVISQCKKDNRYFCSRHGKAGYCSDCIRVALSHTPTSIQFISRGMYVIAGLFFLLDLYLLSQLTVLANDPRVQLGLFAALPFLDPIESMVASLAPYSIALMCVFVGFPVLLIVLGTSLSSGGTKAKWTVVIVSGLMLIFSLQENALILAILPAIFLVLIFVERHWFEIRRIGSV